MVNYLYDDMQHAGYDADIIREYSYKLEHFPIKHKKESFKFFNLKDVR